MEHEQICKWLGLPRESWPPDHYCLLGLKSGEVDIAVIEQHAHDRLAKLRGYQLSHPEQATEAMNRLAQAFMCLSDPASKRAYDLQRQAGPAGAAVADKPATVAGRSTMIDDTAVRPKTQLDWRDTPPPVRAPADAAPLAASENGQVAVQSDIAPAVAPLAAAPISVPIGLPATPPPSRPDISFEARRGLATLPALIERVDLTRQLLTAWDRAGRYINRPKRLLQRDSEQIDLTRRLAQIQEAIARFPTIVGQPGQPGYRVVAMARLQMTAVMFGMLDFAQREALSRDWLAGRQMLLEYRRFLLREFKARRRLNLLHRGFAASRAFLNDYPAWSATIALAVLAGVAVVVFGQFLQ